MTKGLRTTVITLLAVVSVTLGPGLIVRDSPAVGAQAMGGACPWDCQAVPSGSVDVPDLLALLALWGQGVGSPCDFDGGGIAVPDLLKLLGHWGNCPP